MQLRRNFDQQNKFQVGKQLQDAAKAYREADNKPGDLDERPDRVSVQSNEGAVQVILNGDSFVERYQAQDGRVTMSQFDVPAWYDKISRASGTEIQKQEDSVEGQSLGYTVGWTASFHHHDEMKASDALQKFSELEAQFSA